MKKITSSVLSIILSFSILTAAFTFAQSPELLSNKQEMDAVKFYRENKGGDFLYELRPPYGNEIPYGDSKYAPTQCYYPLGSKGEMERPEMYTWGSGEIAVDGDYVKFTPSKGAEMNITFDTSPGSYYMEYSKPYFTVVLKTSRAFEGTIGFKTLDSTYRKFFPVSFTGEWQKIILDFSDPNGWEKRNDKKEFYPYNVTPFSEELNKMYGGHSMHLYGKDSTEYYLFDYIMMFTSLDKAEEFCGLSAVKSTYVSTVPEERTIMTAKSRATLGIMNGYADGTFKPNREVTRAEAIAVIARLMDTESVIAAYRETAFPDIYEDEWYYNYVTYLERYGVTDIFTGELFPRQEITRAELVAMLTRAGAFEPARVSESAADSSVGILNPSETLTRAELAVILGRALDLPERADKESLFPDLDRGHWGYGSIMAVSFAENIAEGEAKILEVDELCEKRISEIRSSDTTVFPGAGGTAYYISTSGDDTNSGTSPDEPWRTLSKVSTHKYNEGDVVYFKRGDIFRIPADSDVLRITQGVSYGAYGEGDKPKIYGSPEDGADPKKWSLVSGTENIWKYARQMIDQGTLIFNSGESYASTYLLYFSDGLFRYSNGVPISVSDLLLENHSIFCETVVNSGVPSPSSTRGTLYLRCDEGNPGEVFESIEFMPSRHMIKAQGSDYHFKNTVIENLCVMYGGAHGIHATSATNFTVKGCEFGFIGGGVQSYSHTTSSGSLHGKGVRYGNAVETGYGNGYYVTNNYIYQCYDAGITFQSTGANVINKDIHFDNNVIERCQYPIEYWEDPSDKDTERYYIEDFTICGNVMREAGVGISQLRPDKDSAAHIKGWTKYNAVKDKSYIISGNIFDRSRDMMVHIGLTSQTADTSTPVMEGNTFIQHVSTDDNKSSFGIYALTSERLSYNDDITDAFAQHGIGENEVYFVK